MEGYEEIEARLRALREQPVDPAVASRHLRAMAAVARPASRLARLKVAAAFAAGLVLGGTGLASAGVMGETVQNRLADTAEKVGIDLPGGTPRWHDDTVCGTTRYKNHGQYVKHGVDPQSDCGKPLPSVGKATRGGTEGDAPAACKPPWAGNPSWSGDKAAWRAGHPECAAAEPDTPARPEVAPPAPGKPAEPGSPGRGGEQRVTPTAPTPSSTVPPAPEEKAGNGRGTGRGGEPAVEQPSMPGAPGNGAAG